MCLIIQYILYPEILSVAHLFGTVPETDHCALLHPTYALNARIYERTRGYGLSGMTAGEWRGSGINQKNECFVWVMLSLRTSCARSHVTCGF